MKHSSTLTWLQAAACLVAFLDVGHAVEFADLEPISGNERLPADAQTADLNRDGRLDVIWMSRGGDDRSPGLRWRAGNADGSFGPIRVFTNRGSGGSIDAFAVGDIDGDGVPDAAAVVDGSDYRTDQILWFRNDGRGNFGAGTLIDDEVHQIATLRIADQNGDGDGDLLSSSLASSQLSWYEYRGSRFDIKRPFNSNQPRREGTYDAEVADLDGDGDLDVVSAMSDLDGFSVYENLGPRTMGPKVVLTDQIDTPYVVKVGDFDGDGDPDVIGGSYNSGDVVWFENQGGMTFGPRRVITQAADGLLAVAAGDLDRDGLADAISGYGQPAKLSWFKLDGNGEFGEQQIILSDVAGRINSVFPADVDHDGRVDLLITVERSGSIDGVYLLRNTTPVAPIIRSFEANPPESPSAGTEIELTWDVLDADELRIDPEPGVVSGDGITVRPDETTTYTLTATNTNGTDSAQYTVIVPGKPRVVRFDADPFSVSPGSSSILKWDVRDADSIVIEPGLGEVTGRTSIAVNPPAGVDEIVYTLTARNTLGNTVATAKLSVHPPLFGSSYIRVDDFGVEGDVVRVADLDGDGNQDAVVAVYDNNLSQSIICYPGDGAGGFAARRAVAGGGDADRVTWMEVGDIDRDGDPDVAYIAFNGRRSGWFRNNGSGGFSHAGTIMSGKPVGFGLYTSDLGDIDGDGDLDIVHTTEDPNDSDIHQISWLLNDGAGRFSNRKVVVADGRELSSLELADIDLDGDLDLFYASEAEDKVAWFEFENGDFGTENVVTTRANRADVVRCADLNGDRYPDLVYHNGDGNRLVWRPNLGNSIFADEISLHDVFFLDSVEFADLDHDGDVDLLYASPGAGEVYWMESSGTGQFMPPVALYDGSSSYSRSVWAGDMDGDGDLDPVLASPVHNRMVVYWANQIERPPKILAFDSTPRTDGTVDLYWEVAGSNALLIDSGVGEVTGTRINVFPDGITDYTLTASNAHGATMMTITAFPDTDGDGLSDDWERRYFGSLDPGPADDGDADGLSNLEEQSLGTAPDSNDSDGDGITDFDEVRVTGSDPMLPDTDGDGHNDGEERQAGSDPLDPGDFPPSTLERELVFHMPFDEGQVVGGEILEVLAGKRWPYSGASIAGGAPGRIGQAVRFGQPASPDATVEFEDAFQPGPDGFAVGLWVAPTGSEAGTIVREGGVQSAASLWGIRTDSDRFQFAIGQSGVAATQDVESDRWQHLALVVDVAAGVWRGYVDGQATPVQQVPADLDLSALQTFTLGTDPVQPAHGMIDDLTVWERPLEGVEVERLVVLGSASVSFSGANDRLTPPVVTNHPLGGFFLVGDAAQLSVGVSGSQPISFQWRRDGQPIPGATASSLSTPSLAVTDSGSYDVVVSNPLGSITSVATTITVFDPHPAQDGRIVATSQEVGQFFGLSVAVDDEWLAVGLPNDGRGSVLLYRHDPRRSSGWVYRQKIRPAEVASRGEFGRALALDGDTLVVGSGHSDNSAWIFRKTAGQSWVEDAHLDPDAGLTGIEFGVSVSVDGNVVAVGAPQDNANGPTSGAVYIYERADSGAPWLLASRVLAGGDYDNLGTSVAVSGDVILAGAPDREHPTTREPSAGVAYVITRRGSSWSVRSTLLPPDVKGFDDFGISVAVAGDTAVVGSPGYNGGGGALGALYVYGRDQGGRNRWGQVTRLLASDFLNSDEFGTRVAIEGGRIFGAAPEDSGYNSSSRNGSVYVFERNEGGTEAWGEVERIRSGHSEEDFDFARSIAVGGSHLAIGSVHLNGSPRSEVVTYQFPGPVNNLPEFTSTPVTTASPGHLYDYPLSADDEDENPMRFEILTAPSWLMLETAGDGSVHLVGTPAPGHIGDHPVLLRVTDEPAGSESRQEFTLRVRNTPPVAVPLEIRLDEDSAEHRISLGTFFDDAEDTDEELVYALVGATNPGLAMVSLDTATEELVINLVPDANGAATINLSATDLGLLGATGPVPLIVAPVDDQPQSTPIPPYVAELHETSIALDLSAHFSDVDDHGELPFSYSVISNTNPGLVSVRADDNFVERGGATIDIAPYVHGESTIRFRATDPTGLFAETEVLITIPKLPNPTVTFGEARLNPQSGLFEQRISVTNEAPRPIGSVKLTLGNLMSSVSLYNATSSPDGQSPEVLVNRPIESGETKTVVFEYLGRQMPTGFEPEIEVEIGLPSMVSVPGEGRDVEIRRNVRLANGDVLVEVSTEPGKIYRVQYTSDMKIWTTSPMEFRPAGTSYQWIDNGLPKTEAHPSTVPARYYRILEFDDP